MYIGALSCAVQMTLHSWVQNDTLIDIRCACQRLHGNGNGRHGWLICVAATFVEAYRDGASITGVEKDRCNPEVSFLIS